MFDGEVIIALFILYDYVNEIEAIMNANWKSVYYIRFIDKLHADILRWQFQIDIIIHRTINCQLTPRIACKTMVQFFFFLCSPWNFMELHGTRWP